MFLILCAISFQYHSCCNLILTIGFIFLKICVIQEHTLKKEIGLGRLAYEVYNFLQAQANHTFIISLHLLHKHLGYTSIAVMKKFHGSSKALNSSLHDCFIC